MTSRLDKLNAEQLQAVLHSYGPMLILAGAGSGKTTVLVTRTGRLIEEKIAEPKKICVLTFTNKAASELKHRVTSQLGQQSKDVWAGTFHSFGLQVLKQFHKQAHLPKGFGILDSSDSQGIVKEILKDLKLAEKADFDAGKLLSLMSDWRSSNKTTAEGDDPYNVAATWLLPKYLKRLRYLGVVDFDGLLNLPLQLFHESAEIRDRIQGAFTQIMVDEFQDTNKTQLQLVQKLAETHSNITVVGDDDQSIYGWRGACIDNILKFPHLYDECKVVRLEQNYRSTPSILRLANAIISKNEKRHAKILKTAKNAALEEAKPEIFVFENEDEEVERIVDDIEQHVSSGSNLSDVAILFRSNNQGALFEAELKRRAIAHKVTGGTGFFERKEIKDLLAYLRCSIKPNEVALRRIINTPSRGVGDTALDSLAQFSSDQKISLFEATKRWREAGVSEASGEGLDSLHHLFRDLPLQVVSGLHHPSPSLRFLHFISELGYKRHLEKVSKDMQQASKRWRFIEIFASVIDKFVARGGLSLKTLKEFTDRMELHDVTDEEEENRSALQLLTLHACKGLEFPIVYLVGLEEEIIPHRTLGSDISEERRLFYVGVTRAQKKLILSRVRERKRFGKIHPSAASRFLLEIPKETYTEYEGGWRPVSQDTRKTMLADLYKKLDGIKDL